MRKMNGEDQDDGLDDQVVVVLDRIDDVAADAGPGEDRLRDDGAGEQTADLEADDRRDRQPCVAHDVARVDALVGQPLGSCRPDIVLVGDVEDGGAGDPRDDSEGDRAQRDGRQDEVADRVPERLEIQRQERVDHDEVRLELHADPRIDPPAGGQPVQLGREDVLQRVAEHEDRDGYPEERDDGHHAVAELLRVAGGPSTERHADADREQHRPGGQLDGGGEARKQLIDDRAVVDHALAEVALQQLRHVEQVLLVERLVQAHAGHDLGCQLRRGVLSEQGLDRVSRDEVDDREDEDGQAEQDRDRGDESSDDVPQHWPVASYRRYGPSPGQDAPGMAVRFSVLFGSSVLD